jgi:hypothetical protein
MSGDAANVDISAQGCREKKHTQRCRNRDANRMDCGVSICNGIDPSTDAKRNIEHV